MRRDLEDKEATEALGRTIGAALDPGHCVLLVGDLGAGKTTLARGVARALGVTGVVPSPTFALVIEHAGRVPLLHADLYRLESDAPIDDLGLDRDDAIVLIEWPERNLGALPADHLVVALTDAGTGRQAILSATGPRHAALLAALSR